MRPTTTLPLIPARALRRIKGALSVACMLACTLGCEGGTNDFDQGAADVTITRGSEEPLRLVHDPELSQITLTPPTENTVELEFAYQDPLVSLRLTVNGEVVDEGAEVTLPIGPPMTLDDLLLELEIDGVLYSSDDSGASGTVYFDVLQIDEDSGYADVIATLDAVLVSTGETASVVGNVEARVGERDDI